MTALRVLVVAEEALVRAGLAALLSDRPGFRVVGQVALPTLEGVELHRPDLIVYDLGWEPETAVQSLADLAESELPILALLPDDAHAAEAWAAGARGLLLREADAAGLMAALRALAEGLAVLHGSLAGAARATPAGPLAAPEEALTPRELEVLQLLAEGLSNRAIAHQLSISEHTVKFHVNALMGKLGAQSRTEAVVRATRLGLIIL